MPQDGFEEAVAATTPKPTAEIAESFYEKREYPVARPGVYNAMIVSAQLRESKSKMDPPGTTKINLRLEILSDMSGKPLEYKGDDGEMHKYQVFSRPFPKNYGDGKKTGKPSNLYKLIMELTGIPPLTDEEPAQRRLADGRIATGTLIRFDHKMLEYMECQIMVKAKEWQGKPGADIESYMCTEEQQKKNYDTLPPHPKKIPHPKFGGVQQQVTQPQGIGAMGAQETADVFKATPGQVPQREPEVPVIAHKSPEENAQLQSEMASRGFPV